MKDIDKHGVITAAIASTGTVIIVMSRFVLEWLQWIGLGFMVVYLILFMYWVYPDLYGKTIKEYFKGKKGENDGS